MFHLPHKIKAAVSGFSVYSILVLVFLLLAGCGSQEVKEEKQVFAYPPPPDKARFYYEGTLRSSFDIKLISATDKLRLFATGSLGTSQFLAKPWGVAVHHGRVYVTDTVRRAVVMFNVPGRQFKIFGTEGLGALRKPIGIATSPDGEVYVADNTARTVVVFDKDGNYLRDIGNRTIFRRPSGVAVSPDGSKVYVIDTGGIETQEHHLFILDAHTGALIRTVGTRGNKEGEFNLPLQVATSKKDGTVYVTDAGNFRVEAFMPNGDFKMAFGQVGRRSGDFARPKGIATDKKGNIYVVDAAYGNFQIFDDKARLLMFIGQRGNQNNPGHYMLPAGIAVDGDGRVYVVDQFFRKVDVFRPADLPENAGYLGGEFQKKHGDM
jgi:DNA-binding beta-propeller fold protein YncE